MLLLYSSVLVVTVILNVDKAISYLCSNFKPPQNAKYISNSATTFCNFMHALDESASMYDGIKSYKEARCLQVASSYFEVVGDQTNEAIGMYVEQCEKYEIATVEYCGALLGHLGTMCFTLNNTESIISAYSQHGLLGPDMAFQNNKLSYAFISVYDNLRDIDMYSCVPIYQGEFKQALYALALSTYLGLFRTSKESGVCKCEEIAGYADLYEAKKGFPENELYVRTRGLKSFLADVCVKKETRYFWKLNQIHAVTRSSIKSFDIVTFFQSSSKLIPVWLTTEFSNWTFEEISLSILDDGGNYEQNVDLIVTALGAQFTVSDMNRFDRVTSIIGYKTSECRERMIATAFTKDFRPDSDFIQNNYWRATPRTIFFDTLNNLLPLALIKSISCDQLIHSFNELLIIFHYVPWDHVWLNQRLNQLWLLNGVTLLNFPMCIRYVIILEAIDAVYSSDDFKEFYFNRFKKYGESKYWAEVLTKTNGCKENYLSTKVHADNVLVNNRIADISGTSINYFFDDDDAIKSDSSSSFVVIGNV